MTRSISSIITMMLLVSLSLLSACKKSDGLGKAEKSNSASLEKLNNWLNEQVANSNKERKERIAEIVDQMNFQQLRIEELHNDLKLLVIPLSEDFRTYYDKSGSSSNELLLIMDKYDNIKSGMIANFLPADLSQSYYPLTNTYSSILNGAESGQNGRYIFLSLFDRHLFQMTYKDGMMISVSHIDNKSKPGSSSKQADVCIDWYLVTTVYYTDGTSETNEEYIETDCYSSCVPGELCDELEGGTGDAPAIIPQSKGVDWVVAENQFHTWYVKSYEVLTGTKISGDLSKFTGIAHSTSTIFNVVNNTIPASWQQLNVIAQLTSEYSASCQVSGKVSIAGSGDADISKINVWYAPSEFP